MMECLTNDIYDAALTVIKEVCSSLVAEAVVHQTELTSWLITNVILCT